DVWITAVVRCAPPGNRPLPQERDACATWLDRELALLPHARVFLCLGQIAYAGLWRHFGRSGRRLPSPRPRFGHGVQVDLDGVTVLASYHPSQLNTFTGRLTEVMLDDVVGRVRGALLAGGAD
ncbi:MAG: uracil-DNA glycosylase, partial [Actinobacteria bacterium]|nr:uracil-DNA glycosylase [Actinomycetota bacterium]